ncbi:MAG: hypothetical protein V3W44_04965 [Dehalococcoidales bacterium]
MARTKAQTRAYISEIVDIVEQIRVMNLRKHELGNRLGFGTYRTRKLPHIVIRVQRGGNGWSVSWKKLAQEFGDLLGYSETTVESRGRRYRKRTHRNPSVAVCNDPANWNSPKLQFVD